MDIFTTQLTRTVPVPIKPTSLKVKALLKESANKKLSHDPDHLENHNFYFMAEEDEYHSSPKEVKQESNQAQEKTVIEKPESNNDELTGQKPTLQSKETGKSAEKTEQKSNKLKHLDLYV